MMAEDNPPTEAELREAELLARALEGDGPGRDLAPVEDALSAAFLLRASRRGGLSELRERAVLERIWPVRSRRTPVGATVAALLAAAAAVALVAVWPHGAAELPAADVRLLRAQLAAARPGANLEPFASEMSGYRAQVYRALGRAYRGGR